MFISAGLMNQTPTIKISGMKKVACHLYLPTRKISYLQKKRPVPFNRPLYLNQAPTGKKGPVTFIDLKKVA